MMWGQQITQPVCKEILTSTDEFLMINGSWGKYLPLFGDFGKDFVSGIIKQLKCKTDFWLILRKKPRNYSYRKTYNGQIKLRP